MSAPANTDASVMITEQAVDFLGFAAQSGLILYVQAVLGSRPEWLDSPTATYLLRCVLCFAPRLLVLRYSLMWLYERDYWNAHSPELVATLVRHGGKPNVSMFSKTVWIIFLEQMYFTVTERRIINRNERSFDLESAWAIAATVFLEHGADVHAMIDIEDTSSMERISQYKSWNTISGALPNSVFVKLQLSVFSILELCLEGVPGWPQIHEVCDAKGAQTYSKCTELRFDYPYKRQYDEHSQERLNDFPELFMQCIKPVRNSNLANTLLEMRRLITRYFEDAPDSDFDSNWVNHESSNESSPEIEHHALELQ